MNKQFNYRKLQSGIEITGYNGNSKEVVIPNAIEGIPVTSIGNYAFYNNQITSVTFPESLQTIGSDAFYNNQITSVTFPESLQTIGSDAFSYNQITSVTFPESLQTIGNYAFYNNQITSVTFPESLQTIGNYAFSNNQITSVTFPESLQTIGNYAFDGNVELRKGNQSIFMVDGIATILRSKKMRDGFEISKGTFFNTGKDCFVAKKDKYTAHGDTIRQAIEDVNFKYLQDNSNVQDIVKDVKASNKITVSQFRLITGACSAGCKNFLTEKGVSVTEMKLPDAMKLLKGAFGWNTMQQYFS